MIMLIFNYLLLGWSAEKFVTAILKFLFVPAYHCFKNSIIHARFLLGLAYIIRGIKCEPGQQVGIFAQE